MKKEEWRDIKKYEGFYQVSNMGNIRSVDRVVKYSDGRIYNYKSTILKQRIAKIHGYYMITLNKNGKVKTHLVHRLVGSSFLHKEEGKDIINHKDGNKLNNNYLNLEWCDKSYNMTHALDNLNIDHCLGEGHFNSYLKEEDVKEIYYLAKYKIIPRKDIALAYNTTVDNISAIVLGKTWKRVTEHE